MILLLSFSALLAAIPLLAIAGTSALRQGLLTGAEDVARHRTLGTALILSSLVGLLFVIGGIGVHSGDAPVAAVTVLRAAVTIAWLASAVFGWKHNFHVRTQARLYTAAATLVIIWGLLQDGAVAWADVFCLTALGAWLFSRQFWPRRDSGMERQPS